MQQEERGSKVQEGAPDNNRHGLAMKRRRSGDPERGTEDGGKPKELVRRQERGAGCARIR